MTPRKRLVFRQSEVARILRAGKNAGVSLKIEITWEGKLTATPIDAAPASPSRNDGWENAFDKPQAKTRPSVQRPAR
jgi:hypothetical protein